MMYVLLLLRLQPGEKPTMSFWSSWEKYILILVELLIYVFGSGSSMPALFCIPFL